MRHGDVVPKYGEAAIAAVQLVATGQAKHPPDAWDAAVKRFFPGSPSSQNKGCPRGAFLGLCESGVVKGVVSGSYTRSKLNKQYALDAVGLLRNSPHLVGDPETLWQRVIGPVTKVENSQMDVVLALWQRGLIHDRLK
jgi:hypothetical protein